MNRKNRTLLSIGRGIMKIFARTLLELNVQYEQEIKDGAKVYCPNHPTTTDPFLLSLVTKEPLPILVNKRIFEVPILGKLITHAGCIPVDKDKGNGQELISRSVEVLSENYPVAIFPEGCLSPEANQMARPHTGAVRIALTAKVPIVPVGIYLNKKNIRTHTFNTKYGLSQSRWIFRGQYYLTVGRPLHFSGDIENWNLVKQFSQHVADEIQRLMIISEESAKQKGIAWSPLIPISDAYPNE